MGKKIPKYIKTAMETEYIQKICIKQKISESS